MEVLQCGLLLPSFVRRPPSCLHGTPKKLGALFRVDERCAHLLAIHFVDGPGSFLRSRESKESGALACACLWIDKNLA